MKATTQAWLDKAECSLATAKQFMEPLYGPYFNGVCLNSQFSAEQYLNACLREADVLFRVLKGLPALFDELLTIDSSLEVCAIA